MIPLLLALACQQPDVEPVTRAQVHMSTRIEVTVPGRCEAEVPEVFEVFAKTEALASEWREESPLAAVNRAAPEPVEVPPELRALLRRSLELAEATGGAFDPTWAALWGLWDFDTPRLPDADEVARRVERVDHRRVRIDEERGTVALTEEGMALGLGAVAKGWALDRAGELLRGRDCLPFALTAGGQVLLAGERERPWRVGVRDPRGAPDALVAVVEVDEGSVSTSGDYERFFELDGVRWHHVLDPRTGWPSRGASSVTVVAPDATRADALSTALLVLGPERGRPLAEAEGLGVVWVDAQGGVSQTGDVRATIARR